MKYILIPFILITLLSGLRSQTILLSENDILNGTEKIYKSIQRQSADRSFVFRPDSVLWQNYSEGHATAPVYYSIKYQNDRVSQIIFENNSLKRKVVYEYNDEGIRMGGIVYDLLNVLEPEIGKYIIHYRANGFLDGMKYMKNNEILRGDSISLVLEGNKITNWKRLTWSYPNWNIATEISDIRFQDEEIISFISTGMPYGNTQNLYNFIYYNLRKLDFQKISIFKEADEYYKGDYFKINTSIFGPEDAAEILLPVHAGADIVRKENLTGILTPIQKSRIIENGQISELYYYDVDDDSVLEHTASYEFNDDGKLMRWISFGNNQPEWNFEYNQYGKLVKEISGFNGSETHSGTDYIYEYDDNDNLVFYTEAIRGIIDTNYYDKYYFFYNGSLDSKSIKHSETEIYPNPVSNTLYFKTTDPVKNVFISDANGTQVAAYKSVKSIDVSHLNPGTYFANIETASGTSIQKFIKL